MLFGEYKFLNERILYKSRIKTIGFGNGYPTFNSVDATRALTDRLMFISIDNHIPEEAINLNLETDLIADALSVLRIALDGLKRLIKNGFKFSYSEAIEQCTLGFIRAYSSAEAFCREAIKTATPEERVSTQVLYELYVRYCDRYDLRCHSYKDFRTYLCSLYQVKKGRPSKGQSYSSSNPVSTVYGCRIRKRFSKEFDFFDAVED